MYEVELSWKDMILTVNSFESLTVSVPPKRQMKYLAALASVYL